MPKTREYTWDGTRLLKARKDAGLNRVELAAACGVKDPNTIRAWEANEQAPQLPTFLRACAALGQNPEDLLVA